MSDVCVCVCVCVSVWCINFTHLLAQNKGTRPTPPDVLTFFYFPHFFFSIYFSHFLFFNLFTSRLFFFQFIFLKSYEVSQSVCSRSVLSLLPRNGIKYNKKYMIFFFEYNIM